VRKLIDLEDKFFAPVWIRVAVILVTTVWGLFEMSAGAPMWGIIFLGFSVVCGWRFATIDYSADADE
jgi:chromate transport protein ChrA